MLDGLPLDRDRPVKGNPPVAAGGAVGIVTVLVGLLAGFPVWAVVVIVVAALAFTLLSQTKTTRPPRDSWGRQP